MRNASIGSALPICAAALVLACLPVVGSAAALPQGWRTVIDDSTCQSVLPFGDDVRCVGQRMPVNSKLSYAVDYPAPPGDPTAARILQPPGVPTASGSGTAYSRDGSCIVGYQDSGVFTPYHAFVWTRAGGPLDLGTLEPAANASLSSFASAVARDCSVVVGTSDTAGGATQRAFRWTAASGMTSLGLPPGASANGASRAFGTSADGAVVVGDAEFPDPNAFSGFRRGAFRWSGGAFQSLGALEPGFFSLASAVSADGAVVVGQGGVAVTVGNTQTNGSRAFRWTAAEGLQAIGPLPGDRFAAAVAMSDDGAVVVGTSSPGPIDRGNLGFNSGTGAFRWTQATGIRDLRQLLVDAGVDMTGVTLIAVTGISPDGQWISGTATRAQRPGATSAFVVRYCDSVTGPCTATPPSVQGLWWNDPAGSESGWGINFAHQGDTIFASWFTFDRAGNGIWLVTAATKTASGIYTGTINQLTAGPAFDAVPFPPVGTPGGATGVAVGTATFTFTGSNAGAFDYTVQLPSMASPVTQRKWITRQVFGPQPLCALDAAAAPALASNYQDLWWAAPAGSESGWGVNLTHQGDTIFATWFTYGHDHVPVWLVVAAVKSAAGVYTGKLYTGTGPPFDAVPFDPSQVNAVEAGTATLRFADGNHGSFDYTVQLPGMAGAVTQSKAITRQVFASPPSVCR